MKEKKDLPINIDLSKELNQILKAFDYADKIKSGKIKTRPVKDLLKEL